MRPLGSFSRNTAMTSHPCMQCGSRETMARFDGETFTLTHAGRRAMVESLSGCRCPACGEVAFDPESAARYAEAGDNLVRQARR